MKDGWLLEHRLVAWEAGLLEDPALEVHHVDEDPTNNGPANLKVVTKGGHRRLHRRIDRAVARRLYEAGASTTEVAGALGTYAGNISRMLREQGVVMRPAGRRYT